MIRSLKTWTLVKSVACVEPSGLWLGMMTIDSGCGYRVRDSSLYSDKATIQSSPAPAKTLPAILWLWPFKKTK
jgi:hypothetical protein